MHTSNQYFMLRAIHPEFRVVQRQIKQFAEVLLSLVVCLIMPARQTHSLNSYDTGIVQMPDDVEKA